MNNIVTETDLNRAHAHLLKALKAEMAVKGDRAFVNAHESLGIVIEEVREFEEAVRSGNLVEIHDEALDVAIAALWTVASLLTHWQNS